jgi:hypothetical protein
VPRDERGAQHRFLARKRADHETLGRQPDPVQPGHPVDIDEGGRLGEAHVECGHQALPAGKHAGVGAEPRKGIERFVQRGGTAIGEGRRLHRAKSAGSLP